MFSVAKMLGGRINVPETLDLPVTAGQTYKVGEALVVTNGALTKASGDVKATYISKEEYVAPSTGARALKCFRVTPDMLFEVEITAFGATQKVGAKVTFGTDGLTLTATAAESGGAEIVHMNNAAKAGDKIYVVLA